MKPGSLRGVRTTILIKRTKLSVFSIALICFCYSSLWASDIASLIAAGDSLYLINDYKLSAKYYKEAVDLDSNSFDANLKLSRSLNFQGEMAPKDSQLAIFEYARDEAKRAIALNDKNADAHFQLARALGKIALFKGIFKSASIAKQVKAQAEMALALDSLHDGAWHILGRWNREVGRKPKFIRAPMGLGAANKKDAVDFMKKAIELNPNYINHHLEMGITYMTYDMDDLAKEEFQKCLSLASQRPLDDKYKIEAQNLLAELNKK